MEAPDSEPKITTRAFSPALPRILASFMMMQIVELQKVVLEMKNDKDSNAIASLSSVFTKELLEHSKSLYKANKGIGASWILGLTIMKEWKGGPDDNVSTFNWKHEGINFWHK